MTEVDRVLEEELGPERVQPKKREWYFRSWAIVVAILCFGPLGLFLLWFRPRTNLYIKIFVSVLVFALTVWMARQTSVVYKQLMQYYEQFGDVVQGA